MTTRILVVEDDVDVRHVVSDALQDAGYAVATATDGADALDQIDQHPPDAILLDLAMPSMDGWSFLEAFQNDDRCAGIPVGIMSANPMLRHTADAFGVQVAIAKPFALEELVARVEHLLSPLPCWMSGQYGATEATARVTQDRSSEEGTYTAQAGSTAPGLTF